MAQSSREIYWSAILADFRRSGLTHVQFCQLRRISLHSFRDWLYRLRPGLPPRRSRTGHTSPTPSHPKPIARLPAGPCPSPTSGSPSPLIKSPSLQLHWNWSSATAAHLRVPAGFDPATLHQLLDVLEERS